MENHKRILVIRLSSIGDVILTTPVLKAFKEKYPDVQSIDKLQSEIDKLKQKEENNRQQYQCTHNSKSIDFICLIILLCDIEKNH